MNMGCERDFRQSSLGPDLTIRAVADSTPNANYACDTITGMDVRPAEQEDADRVAELTEAAWWSAYAGFLSSDSIREGLAEGYDAEFIREVLNERDDILFIICELQDEIVGYGTAQQSWADEVEIHALFVDPDRWGEGAGTELLDAIEVSARAADVDRLRVTTFRENRVGRAFLEARGFEQRESETLEAEVGDAIYEEVVYERPVGRSDHSTAV